MSWDGRLRYGVNPYRNSKQDRSFHPRPAFPFVRAALAAPMPGTRSGGGIGRLRISPPSFSHLSIARRFKPHLSPSFASGSGAEEKGLGLLDGQTHPAGSEDASKVAVREQCDISIERAEMGNEAIRNEGANSSPVLIAG